MEQKCPISFSSPLKNFLIFFLLLFLYFLNIKFLFKSWLIFFILSFFIQLIRYLFFNYLFNIFFFELILNTFEVYVASIFFFNLNILFCIHILFLILILFSLYSDCEEIDGIFYDFEAYILIWNPSVNLILKLFGCEIFQ